MSWPKARLPACVIPGPPACGSLKRESRSALILESFWQIFSPFCAQAIVKRLACTGDLWKRLLSAEWDASIDHDAGIAAVVLGVVAHRVERGTPAPMNDVDLIARVAARAHR